jgi:putative redox protein
MNYLCKNLFMVHVEIQRVSDDYGFEGKDAFGHSVKMDSSPESGGHNFGIRPMQMLLMGLGGCSGIDVVSILKKQKQPLEGLRILVDGERATGKEATIWKFIKITFVMTGSVEAEKAKRACALSIEKYCSVAATLMGAGCTINWELEIKS